MERRAFIRNSSLTLACLAFLSNRSLARLLEDPAWKIKMLTKEIGVFTEKGGTILFMVSKEGFVVVDSQFPEQSKHLIDELTLLGCQVAPRLFLEHRDDLNQLRGGLEIRLARLVGHGVWQIAEVHSGVAGEREDERDETDFQLIVWLTHGRPSKSRMVP